MSHRLEVAWNRMPVSLILAQFDSMLYRFRQNTIIKEEQNESTSHHIGEDLKKISSIVESSVPRERLPSIAGNIASDKRNRLDPSRLDRLLFLKSLDIKHWEL
ncbi:hypothetical protein TNCV_1402541 [Trichonephila clavipes]|nr:hypothetical protein TNCV_1402541 [Trichonephila clavipes]